MQEAQKVSAQENQPTTKIVVKFRKLEKVEPTTIFGGRGQVFGFILS